MWLFASAWESPDRNMILGIAMALPLLAAALIVGVIVYSWNKKPLLKQTSELIAHDWQLFRTGLHGNTDKSDDANR